VPLRISCIILIFLLTLQAPICAQNAVPPQKCVTVIRPEFVQGGLSNANLFHCRSVKRPRIAVVFSGGGARGIASIGVLRAFERNDIPIDLIVGTSMGSVIGGLYAMGYSPDQLQRIIDTTNWEDLLSYNDEAMRRDMFMDQKTTRNRSMLVLRFEGLSPVIPEAFSSGQRLTNYLNILTIQAIYKPIPSFDDLRIPFRAVATDLVTGKRIVLDEGDMTMALRASLSVPLLFSSVPRDSMQLLDGGLVDNLPVDVAIAHNADIVIAVDMVSPLRPKSELNAPWKIADQITTIMMQETIKLARAKADIVITPKIGDHLSSDFTGLDSLITAGEIAAEESIPLFKQFIKEAALKKYQADSVIRYEKPRFSWTGELLSDYRDSLKIFEKQGWVTKADLQILAHNLYEEGSYADVEEIVEQQKDSANIKIVLTPNPVLQSVDILGNTVFSNDTLLTAFRPLYGQYMNTKKTVLAFEHLLAIYRTSGYPFARVRNVKFDTTANKIGIILDEGVAYRTDIKGTRKTRDWVIRRELPWHENDILTLSNVSQGIANLYGTGLFEQMHLSVHHEGDSSQYNITTIHARERNTELIRLGLRIDNERNIQPSVELRDENLFGAGAEIGLLIGGGTRNQSYVAELKMTRVFNTYLTFNLKGYSIVRDINFYEDGPTNNSRRFERIRTGEYEERRVGGIISFGAQLERLGSATIKGRLEKINIDNIYDNKITNQEYNISSIRFGTSIDTQDKFPYPTDGIAINFFYESALMKLVDAPGFTKMYFSYETYNTFHKGHVIHPRFIIGVADETLPISEQFSLGGQQDFFGFREDNARGRQLLTASLEYQYKLPFSLFFDTYFKARYDFGSIWAKTMEMRLKDFKHGVGVTIGLDTPIGPAEFSLGRSFNFVDRSVKYGPLTAYFSIGYPIFGIVRN